MNDVVVVNEKDEVIGTMPRAVAHSNGTPHRIAVVYLENDKDEILVQVRISGTFDHSSAGHVDPGESYYQTALREAKEELGISDINLISIGKGVSEEKAKKERKDDGIPEHRTHVFEAFVCHAEPKDLAVDEVKDVYWAKPEEVLRDMNANPKKYTGGFKASLKIYLNWKNKYSQLANKLKAENFKHVFYWHDEPNTKYESHAHKGKVSFYITRGSVTFSGGITRTIKAGERFDVPVGVTHSAIVGSEGCDWIVGEEIKGDS